MHGGGGHTNATRDGAATVRDPDDRSSGHYALDAGVSGGSTPKQPLEFLPGGSKM